MSSPIAPEVHKIRKLAQLPDEVRHSRFAVSITRLTILKSLCRQPERANPFVIYLAQLIRQKVKTAKRPGQLPMADWVRHCEMIDRTVLTLEKYLEHPPAKRCAELQTLFLELVSEQNDHRRVYGMSVRQIKDNDLLLVEYALRTVLADEASMPLWAYRTARCYAERYDASHGAGLIAASAPLVQDIADFWIQQFGLVSESITTPTKARNPREARAPARSVKQKVQFTLRQGQFLAFIHLYRRLHRRGPAELDMVQYFRVTPPSVHGMVVKLEQLGLVTREPGVPRSVRVTIPATEFPALEKVDGPPW